MVSLAVIAGGCTAALCVHAHAVVASIYEVFFSLCHTHTHTRVTTMQEHIPLPNLTWCVFRSRCAARLLQP